MVIVNTGQDSEVCWVYAAYAFAKCYTDKNDVYVGEKNSKWKSYSFKLKTFDSSALLQNHRADILHTPL